MERLDVVYTGRPGRDLHLDIYSPTGAANHRTAILLFHGGGFRQGDRKMLRAQCAGLAARGFTAIAVEYRLINDLDVTWPAPLHDAKDAIAWAAAHAGELGVDADKIVLQGHSAGGLVALMAAGVAGKPEFRSPSEPEGPPPQIAAVVAYYPAVRLVLRDVPSMPVGQPPTPELMAQISRAVRADDGTTPASMALGPNASEAEASAASPLTHVSKAFPPTLIFHGTVDRVVAPIASWNLFQALQGAGVPAEFHMVAGVDHVFDGIPSLYEVCLAATESFLLRYLIDPAGFADEEARHSLFGAAPRPA